MLAWPLQVLKNIHKYHRNTSEHDSKRFVVPTLASMTGTSFFIVSSKFQLSLRWSKFSGCTLSLVVDDSNSSCRPFSSTMAFCDFPDRMVEVVGTVHGIATHAVIVLFACAG